MTGRAVLTAIGPSGVRRYRIRLLRGHQRPSAPAATDRLAPKQSATAPAPRQRRRPDAEIVCGGRVDEEVAHPHPSQTRMCRFPASGSSWESLARGGADDTIRDLLAKKDSR